mgnify:CR=1 FL=1|tara:strand:+ start:1666 stop:2895 length:1230 start_codon:yes stop_codon:yes gene_type:complete
MTTQFISELKSKLKISKDIMIEGYEGVNLKAYDKNNKVLNFSPGPTALPEEVMTSIINELMNEWTLGVTPLEISHRSPEFLKIKDSCEELFTELLEIPNDYSLIWTHGGGHGQFSAVPLNLTKDSEDSPIYFVNGTWSNRSFLEAKKFCNPQKVSLENYTTEALKDLFKSDAPYLYFCSNETINGFEFRNDGIPIPSKEDTNNKIVVVDMSSDILSKRINWNNIDVAFACAPKNFGFPGSSITIINNNLLNKSFQYYQKSIPSLLDWKLIKDSESFWNTLPVFNIYVTDKILKYYKKIGGIKELEEISKKKAEIIYSILDSEEMYQPLINNLDLRRSRMNIPFYLKNKENTKLFLDNAFINNIVGFKTKTPFSDPENPDPLRISLYNPITLEDTVTLAVFMKEFAKLFY